MTSPNFTPVKALIVDDSSHMRALLRAMLQSFGMLNFYEATDGESGFAALLDCKPDIVITDLSMQGTDGIEFTRKIRRSRQSPNPIVPILMVTGHTQRSRIEAARDAGVTEFLAKPFTAQHLLERLTSIVDRPRPFVRCECYSGPDRRRRRRDSHTGPWRRLDDIEQLWEIE